MAVAEELNFAAAAARLNISQPPLSQQIKDLELELGTALFDRTSRRVGLTPVGVSFLEHARAILVQTETAAKDARAIGAGLAGVITIGTTGSVLLGPLAELIAAFGERYRGIGVRIQEMVPHEQQAALLARRIDIGFLRRPRREPDLVSEIAWRENVGLALPETHRLAECEELSLSALKDENLVFLRRADSQFAQYLQNCCIEAGFMPRISYEVVESYSLISLVAAGLGVAIVPESLRKLSRPGVVYRRFAAPAPIADVEMTYRPDSTKVIKRFVGLAREVLTPSRRSASLQSNGKPFRDAIVS